MLREKSEKQCLNPPVPSSVPGTRVAYVAPTSKMESLAGHVG